MAIEDDYSIEDVKTMKYELERYNGKCYYDENKKKIMYGKMEDAMKAYCGIQEKEMENHKWIESEKAHTDLGYKKIKEWVCKYSKCFRSYWQRTHIFMP